MTTSSSGQEALLLLCEGNVCRSPFAERVLRNSVGESKVWVTSRGLAALDGEPLDHQTARVLATLGISSEGHVARTVTPEEIGDATLVLTATGRQRGRAVALAPRAVHHALTVRQLAQILRVTPAREPLTLAGLREHAFRHRSEVLGHAHTEDVTDPYGRPLRHHVASARETLGALREIVAALGGEDVPPAPRTWRVRAASAPGSRRSGR